VARLQISRPRINGKMTLIPMSFDAWPSVEPAVAPEDMSAFRFVRVRTGADRSRRTIKAVWTEPSNAKASDWGVKVVEENTNRHRWEF
jgi:hypothetical protein